MILKNEQSHGSLRVRGERSQMKSPGDGCLNQRFSCPSILVLCLALAPVFFSLQPVLSGDRPETNGKPGVFVSILPLEFFVNRLANGLVETQVLVGPGMSPATYEPLPRQMAALLRARLLFVIGVPFERSLLSKLRETMPGLRIIDSRGESAGAGAACPAGTGETTGNGNGGGPEALHDRAVAEEADHGHGCSHDGIDPHVWMSPVAARRIARNVLSGLLDILPQSKEELGSRFEALDSELAALDLEIKAILAPYSGRSFFVYHPAYGHFASAYGLRQVSVEREGKEPSPRGLANLIRAAKAEGVRVIFAQPQFSTSWAEALARSVGGRVVTLDPLSRDYVLNMRALASSIAESFGPPAPIPPARAVDSGGGR